MTSPPLQGITFYLTHQQQLQILWQMFKVANILKIIVGQDMEILLLMCRWLFSCTRGVVINFVFHIFSCCTGTDFWVILCTPNDEFACAECLAVWTHCIKDCKDSLNSVSCPLSAVNVLLMGNLPIKTEGAKQIINGVCYKQHR